MARLAHSQNYLLPSPSKEQVRPLLRERLIGPDWHARGPKGGESSSLESVSFTPNTVQGSCRKRSSETAHQHGTPWSCASD